MQTFLPPDLVMLDAMAYRAAVDAYLLKEITDTEFKAIRGFHGVHLQRGGQDWMLRIKVPGGRLDRSQLEAVADIAQSWSGQESVHLTTRQDLQIYGLKLEDSAQVMEALAEAGLSCYGSGGASVRNMTCPAESGLIEGEAFDPFPWALALASAMDTKREFSNLPRKIKIAFASEAGNLSQAMSCDLGFVARMRDSVPGFEVYAGGGLGALPKRAGLLEEFVAAAEILDVTEATLKHFNAEGKRAERARSRMKFLLMDEGLESFKNKVRSYRQGTLLIPVHTGTADDLKQTREDGISAPQDWLTQNVLLQKQEGFAALRFRLPQGDIPAEVLGKLTTLMKRHHLSELRLGLDQDLLLPWVPSSQLGNFYSEIFDLGLEKLGAGSVEDVVCCAGPQTCNRGMLNSKALAGDIEEVLAGHSASAGQGSRIHVSGCVNGCGQHLLGAVGVQGMVKKRNGVPSPYYKLTLAGGSELFGRPVIDLPARRVSHALKRLLDAYAAQAQPIGLLSFRQWAQASSVEEVRTLLSDLDETWSDELRMDVASNEVFSPGGLGASEC